MPMVSSEATGPVDGTDPIWGSFIKGGVRVHAEGVCGGEHCPFHNPSDHAMREYPVVVRLDKGALVERTCPHGVGHPDPDSMSYLVARDKKNEWLGVHGCDGCCG